MMQDYSPHVSVIIPTFNRKHLIQNAIKSVLNQTIDDYEIIIVDDASTDGTVEFISTTYPSDRYPSIHIISFSENKGASAARNEGVRSAKGSLIAFLDSDDFWTPNFLQKHIETLQGNPQCVLSFCAATEFSANRSEGYSNYKPWSGYPHISHHLLLIEDIILTMSVVMVRREALLQAGLFNEDLKICEDTELYLRLLDLGHITYIPEALVCKLRHPNTSLIGNYSRHADDYQMFLNIFFDNKKYERYKSLKFEVKSYAAIKMAKLIWYSYRDTLFVLKTLIQAARYSPHYAVQALLRSPSRAADDLWEKLQKVEDRS